MTRNALIVILAFAALPALAQSSELTGSPIHPAPLRIVPAPSLTPSKVSPVAKPADAARPGDTKTNRRKRM